MATRLNLFELDAFPEQMSWRDFATAMERSTSLFDKINNYDKYLKSAEWRDRYWQKMSEAHEADYKHRLNLGESAHPYYKQLKQYYDDTILSKFSTRNNALCIRELIALEEKKINLEKSLAHVAPPPANVVMANGKEKTLALLKRETLINKRREIIAKIGIALENLGTLKSVLHNYLIGSMVTERALTKCIDLMRGPYFNDNKITFYVKTYEKESVRTRGDFEKVLETVARFDESIENVDQATQMRGGSRKSTTARSRKYKNKTRVALLRKNLSL